ncbi:MAG TPA: cold shock domain-containing protein [Chitinophagaceae bacterium]|jgi:cold shock CspA family protein
MGKGHETWNKKEREQKKLKEKKQKEEKKKERQKNSLKGKNLDDMMAYIDENGNLSATPPDPKKKKEIKAEEIEIGVVKQQLANAAEIICKGRVNFFNMEKGYGFIKDHKTMQSIFVHINSCQDPIQEKSEVVFEVEFGPKGASAVNVRLADK